VLYNLWATNLRITRTTQREREVMSEPKPPNKPKARTGKGAKASPIPLTPADPKRATVKKGTGKSAKTTKRAAPLGDSEVGPIAGIPDESALDQVAASLSAADRDAFATARRLLAEHLGSHAAARLWFVTPGTGFETTALDAVRNGQAALVLATLESQWGMSPIHA
jgi:hypothetical protein